MGNDKTLAMIAKAAKKLERIDPGYSERMVENKNRRRGPRTSRDIGSAHHQRTTAIVLNITKQDHTQDVYRFDDALTQLQRRDTVTPHKMIERRRRIQIDSDKTNEGEIGAVDVYLAARASGHRTRQISVASRASLATKRQNRARTIEVNGQALTLKECSEVTGITLSTIYTRLRQGWSEAAALSIPPRTIMGDRAHDRGWAKTFQSHARTGGGQSPDSPAK